MDIQEQQNKRSPRFPWLTTASAFFIGVFAVCGCVSLICSACFITWWFDIGDMQDSYDAETIARIKNDGGFSLPGSAKNVRQYLDGLQGYIYYIRFQFPSKDLETFLSNTCFEDNSRLTQGYVLSKDFSAWFSRGRWWIPNGGKTFVGGRCEVDEGDAYGGYRGYSIQIDMTDPELYTVYVLGDYGD
jgi:hypothetical protein